MGSAFSTSCVHHSSMVELGSGAGPADVAVWGSVLLEREAQARTPMGRVGPRAWNPEGDRSRLELHPMCF